MSDTKPEPELDRGYLVRALKAALDRIAELEGQPPMVVGPRPSDLKFAINELVGCANTFAKRAPDRAKRCNDAADYLRRSLIPRSEPPAGDFKANLEAGAAENAKKASKKGPADA